MTNQPCRLAEGGDIDRSRALTFQFNGQPYTGYAGDSLASALLANGVHFVARSFKYHRPRGIFSAGEEEPNALLQIGLGHHREPTCRAPLVPLTDGLFAHSQLGWPTLGFDLGRILDRTHRLWPAGFYYKTFKWPRWQTWESMVRHLSGLGRPLHDPDPDRYEQVNAHCDLLVCGGGPAGLMSALVAARTGLRVIVADQDWRFGGVLNWEQADLDGKPAIHWVNEVVSELESIPGVMLLPRTTATGIYDNNVTTLLQRGENRAWRECLWTVRPRRVVLATGAIEQGLVFANNDRPGIMLAGSIRHYLNRYAVVPGYRVVIVANNDSAYQTVFDLLRQGIKTLAVVDNRSKVAESLRTQLQSAGVPLHAGARIRNTWGDRRINVIGIESLDGKPIERVRCDLLGVSGGWAARVHLLCHARGTLCFDHESRSFVPSHTPAGFRVIGSAAGIAGLSETLIGAASGAMDLSEELGVKAYQVHVPRVTRRIIESCHTGNPDLRPAKQRQWIDLAHDVTFADAELAVREGYDAVEHFKRFTTTGMSVDQGKTANLNALLALSSLTGKRMDELGTTTYRPPYAPVTLGAIAGPSLGSFYAPNRYLPAHRVHQRLDAVFAEYGAWLRPDYYPRENESPENAIQREVQSVRETVGIFDNSPIGKIEVCGPNAAEFLNRIYVNNIHSLGAGRSCYGLMLNENGVIMDDGVCSRLSDDHFLVNTTSGGVSRIMALFEEWLQCGWRDLSVLADDVTTQWANFTIAGPNARGLLEKLGTDIDVSPEAFPHMSLARGTLAGEHVRIVRVSFSGEASFEVNLRAGRSNHFLARVLQEGHAFGLTPYGIEALMVLRLEKGYFHVGSDTDGDTTPDDVGWGRRARGKSADYIGKRSLLRPANLDSGRRQLVGLVAQHPGQVIRAGGHLLSGADRHAPAATDGWITSAAFSPHLARYIGLAMLRNGKNMQGQLVTVIDEARRYTARVVPLPFWDSENERLEQ